MIPEDAAVEALLRSLFDHSSVTNASEVEFNLALTGFSEPKLLPPAS